MRHVYYFGHGVGEYLGTEKKSILGTSTDFITIRIVNSGMRVMIPEAQRQNLTRPLMDRATALECLNILDDKAIRPKRFSSWNQRYRKYMETIRDGSPLDIARVIVDIRSRRSETEFSFGERKLLDFVYSDLMREITIVLEGESERKIN